MADSSDIGIHTQVVRDNAFTQNRHPYSWLILSSQPAGVCGNGHA